MRSNVTQRDFLELVLYAVNELDPETRAKVLGSLKTHVPVVRWFTLKSGRVDAVLAS